MTPDPLPLEINVQQAKELLASSSEIMLLDCREQPEFDYAKIEQARLIPMSEIQARKDELEAFRDQHVIVHCHHGGRSLQVTQWMRQLGFSRVQNMAGGIDAWSLNIDPSIPRY